MKKVISFFTLLLFILASAQAQLPEQKGVDAINKNTAQAIVEFLASDELEGREAGTRGGRIASAYLASYLKDIGIQPMGNSYYHPFKPASFPDLQMQNVIGMIQGKNSEEFIVIGAHYDHLGINPELPDDQIYNGADDNASGVSAVLQIAKAFLATGVQPERSVIFAFWDGEEKRMLGSRFFADNYPNMEKVKAYLNFDMIGRNHDENNPTHVKYLYTSANTAFKEWLESDIKVYNLQLSPEYETSERLDTGSDNVSFARHNKPIMWFHTDGHPDYHKPTDHADKLNWDKMIDITKAAFLGAWRLANEDNF